MNPADLFPIPDARCMRCGAHRVYGVMLRDGDGAHQHTIYACAAWPRCLWTGYHTRSAR